MVMTHTQKTKRKEQEICQSCHALKNELKRQRLKHAVCKTVSCLSQMSCLKMFLLQFITFFRPAFAQRCLCLQGWWSQRTGWRVWGAAPPQSRRPQGRARRWFSQNQHQGAVWWKQKDKQPTFISGTVFKLRFYWTRIKRKGMMLLCLLC